MNKDEEAEWKRKMEIMWRGMYGEEEPNRTIGAVDEIKILKKFNENLKKYGYIIIGVILAIRGAIWIVEQLHLI